MAVVKDGKVTQVGPNDSPNDYVVCDLCKRVFHIKHAICVCRG